MPYFGPFAANWVRIWVGDFSTSRASPSWEAVNKGGQPRQRRTSSRSRTCLEAGDASTLRRPAWEIHSVLKINTLASKASIIEGDQNRPVFKCLLRRLH
jgi:hypothetical protein